MSDGENDERPTQDEYIHVLRVIEYIGPREWVESVLARSANGVTQWAPHGFTRSTILGPVSDPFSKSFDRPPFAQPEDTFVSQKSIKQDDDSVRYSIAVIRNIGHIGVEYGICGGPYTTLQEALNHTPKYPNSVIVQLSAALGYDPIALFSWNETLEAWVSCKQ
jgi:hypothetical protein